MKKIITIIISGDNSCVFFFQFVCYPHTNRHHAYVSWENQAGDWYYKTLLDGRLLGLGNGSHTLYKQVTNDPRKNKRILRDWESSQ